MLLRALFVLAGPVLGLVALSAARSAARTTPWWTNDPLPLLNFAGLALVALAAPPARSPVLRGAGVVGLTAGTALAATAIRALGPNWEMGTSVYPGQRIVMTGPYRWLAHPLYAGVGLMWVAAGLAFSGMFRIMSVCSALLLWQRAHSEDRRLHAMLGERYARYRRGVL